MNPYVDDNGTTWFIPKAWKEDTMTKQYVQHISGQGEKWTVRIENYYQWGVDNGHCTIGDHWLPKSEYRLCEPPEVWRDVTEDCSIGSYPNENGKDVLSIIHHGKNVLCTWYGYRLRKVQVRSTEDFNNPLMWAFIIEQKVPQ